MIRENGMRNKMRNRNEGNEMIRENEMRKNEMRKETTRKRDDTRKR
jgi:hypothetical protein